MDSSSGTAVPITNAAVPAIGYWIGLAASLIVLTLATACCSLKAKNCCHSCKRVTWCGSNTRFILLAVLGWMSTFFCTYLYFYTSITFEIPSIVGCQMNSFVSCEALYLNGLITLIAVDGLGVIVALLNVRCTGPWNGVDPSYVSRQRTWRRVMQVWTMLVTFFGWIPVAGLVAALRLKISLTGIDTPFAAVLLTCVTLNILFLFLHFCQLLQLLWCWRDDSWFADFICPYCEGTAIQGQCQFCINGVAYERI
jgi:hypothetical protein